MICGSSRCRQALQQFTELRLVGADNDGSGILAQQGVAYGDIISDYPQPLHPVHVLALSEPYLTHLVQLVATGRGATGIVDMNHRPSATQSA